MGLPSHSPLRQLHVNCQGFLEDFFFHIHNDSVGFQTSSSWLNYLCSWGAHMIFFPTPLLCCCCILFVYSVWTNSLLWCRLERRALNACFRDLLSSPDLLEMTQLAVSEHVDLPVQCHRLDLLLNPSIGWEVLTLPILGLESWCLTTHGL